MIAIEMMEESDVVYTVWLRNTVEIILAGTNAEVFAALKFPGKKTEILHYPEDSHRMFTQTKWVCCGAASDNIAPDNIASSLEVGGWVVAHIERHHSLTS